MPPIQINKKEETTERSEVSTQNENRQLGEKQVVCQRDIVVSGHSRHRISSSVFLACQSELAKVDTRIKLSEEIGFTAFTLASSSRLRRRDRRGRR